MHLMQYEIEIPAGYDIRQRIQTRGGFTDDYPDLGLKAYCITDTHYSPFYFWRQPRGMNKFLFQDGGFQHIVNDFGRPPVRHWMGQDFRRGPAATARAATRRTSPYPPADDRMTSERPGVFASATGIDPCGWQFVEFTLWENEPPADAEGVRYEIGHLSIPELAQL
jgi:Domain of unknown function (DUF4865)